MDEQGQFFVLVVGSIGSLTLLIGLGWKWRDFFAKRDAEAHKERDRQYEAKKDSAIDNLATQVGNMGSAVKDLGTAISGQGEKMSKAIADSMAQVHEERMETLQILREIKKDG